MPLGNENQSASNNESKKYSVIADKIFSCINDHLTISMDQLLDNADKRLFYLAEKADPKEEKVYINCTREFQAGTSDVSQHFFANLKESLTSSEAISANNDGGELSLVNQYEMEKMVLITSMYTTVQNIYDEEISNLETRLEYLNSVNKNSINEESLTPKNICELFQTTLEATDFTLEIKMVFYKSFDKELCSKLGTMYKAINQLFISNDVMPEIALKVTKQDERDVSSQVASCYDPDENKSSELASRLSEGIISRIANEFISGDMSISGNELTSNGLKLPESFLQVPTQQDIDGKNCYERKDILTALSATQNTVASSSLTGDAALDAEQIKQELVADISRQNGGLVDKQVNLLDERSIDFVGMMFSEISEDKAVSEIMTNLIYQLLIPVIKIAMLDDSLFEDEAHPARKTVDLLAIAGKGITVKEDDLYDDLEKIVNSILENFDIDIAAFKKAVVNLEEIVNKEERVASETERKQQEKVLQTHARDVVVNQLKIASNEKQIPLNVRPLILKHWSTLMVNRYIRHGRDSSQWIQSVLLLKLLLKCMQPIQYPSQFNMVKNNHLALLEAVNDELYKTQQNKKSISSQIKELKVLFLEIIDGYDFKIVDVIDQGVDEAALINDSKDSTQQELDNIKEQTEIAKRKIAQLSASTKPGVWYEIFNGKDKPVRRLKLSVILTDAAQLIFVDRRGLKVIEKDAEIFANELEENRSRLIADHSTFDQALGNVIKALTA